MYIKALDKGAFCLFVVTHKNHLNETDSFECSQHRVWLDTDNIVTVFVNENANIGTPVTQLTVCTSKL